MFLKSALVLGLCAAPVCAQDWQFQPAALALSPPETAGAEEGRDSYDLFDAPSLGLLEVRQDGLLCLDLPGGRNNCDLAFRGEELMLIDRQAQGRIRVRFRFGIRP